MKYRTIDSFKGDYDFLSNFFPVKITYNGYEFGSVEAAYQAMKDPLSSADFVGLNPSDAKRFGRGVQLRPDWEEVKDSIMLDLLYLKFGLNEDLKALLIGTGNADLIEGNTWRDTYWGVYNGQGKNTLGKLLMRVRDTLSKQYNTVYFLEVERATPDGITHEHGVFLDKKEADRRFFQTLTLCEQDSWVQEVTQNGYKNTDYALEESDTSWEFSVIGDYKNFHTMIKLMHRPIEHTQE